METLMSILTLSYSKNLRLTHFFQSWPIFWTLVQFLLILIISVYIGSTCRKAQFKGILPNWWYISGISIWKWRSFIVGSDRFLITWWSSRKARSTFQSFQKRICLITNSRFPFSSRTDSKTTDCRAQILNI